MLLKLKIQKNILACFISRFDDYLLKLKKKNSE
jgi:hypothetical protein